MQDLSGNGERIVIDAGDMVYENMDVYQKSHYKRYLYASSMMSIGNVCGDFACGTGYGSIILSEISSKVIGADINKEVVDVISEKYKTKNNVSFIHKNIINLDFNNIFDCIVSFETIEHLQEEDIIITLNNFNKSLKKYGKLIFSTPYMQEKSSIAVAMGHHKTFYINESRIHGWLAQSGFSFSSRMYQNYDTHEISEFLTKKDFIITVANKK